MTCVRTVPSEAVGGVHLCMTQQPLLVHRGTRGLDGFRRAREQGEGANPSRPAASASVLRSRPSALRPTQIAEAAAWPAILQLSCIQPMGLSAPHLSYWSVAANC